MKEVIEDIREKLEEGAYKNEEHVRLNLVTRILGALGWNIWDPDEVNSEWLVAPEEDKTKVDIALFVNTLNPSVFIEIKAVDQIQNQLSKIERQLRDYNRNNTAIFSIITDGRIWRLYLSQTGGEFSQKCFKEINLSDDDSDEIELSFFSFLNKEEVSKGNALKDAEYYLKLNQKQRVMEDCLPQAKKEINEPPFLSLPDTLVKLTRKMGIDIDHDEATDFIKLSIEKKSQDKKEGRFEKSLYTSTEGKDQNDHVEIKIVPTSRNYNLFQPKTSDRNFFPGYKILFTMKSDIGDIKAHMTSAPKGTKEGDPKAGQYITGRLIKQWYKKHPELKVGDRVVIRSLEKNKIYSLEIKNNN